MEWFQTFAIIGASLVVIVSVVTRSDDKIDKTREDLGKAIHDVREDLRKEIITSQKAILWIQFKMDPTMQHPPKLPTQKSSEE